MITEQTDPVAWYSLTCELEDAQEGINSLFKDMLAEGAAFSEVEFAIHMRHIYGHINRAWNSRNATDKQHEEGKSRDDWNKFPTDLDLPF